MLRAGLVAGSSPIVMTRTPWSQAAVFDAVMGDSFVHINSMSIRHTCGRLASSSGGPGGLRDSHEPLRKWCSDSQRGSTGRAWTRAALCHWRTSRLTRAAHRSTAASRGNNSSRRYIPGDPPTGSRSRARLQRRRWRVAAHADLSSILHPALAICSFQYGAAADGFAPGVWPPHRRAHETVSTRDFNQVKTMGSVWSAARTPDHDSLFWNLTDGHLPLESRCALSSSNLGAETQTVKATAGTIEMEAVATRCSRTLDCSLNSRWQTQRFGCWDCEVPLQLLVADHLADLDDGNPGTTPYCNVVGHRDAGHPEGPSGHVARQWGGAPYWHMSSTTASVQSGILLDRPPRHLFLRHLSTALEELSRARAPSAGITPPATMFLVRTSASSVARFVLENAFHRIR